MNRLVVLKEGKQFQELPLQPYMGIGRRPNCEVQLEDPRLSRDHAEIYRKGSSYYYKDGSTNGSFLNGQKLEPDVGTRLSNKDFVILGPFELRFVIEEEAPAGVGAPPAEYDGPPPSSPVMEHLVSGRERIPVWSKGEIEVKVADIIEETHDVQTYRFVGQNPLMFSYKPGQFVTLILNIDGKDVKRSYSMSSSPSRPHTIEITVKRVPGGLVSNWLADHLKLGDTVRIRGPAGKFSCFQFPSRKMLFVGAGSGITPLMSMSRWILDTVADIDVKFLVSTRTPRDIIFARELELMGARHSGFQCAVTVTSSWGGTESWMGLTGRVNHQMFELVAPDLSERHVFACGPEPFMAAAGEILKEMGFPMDRLHTESFGAGRVAKGIVVEPRDVPKRTAPRVVSSTPQAHTPTGVAEPKEEVAVGTAAEQFEINFLQTGTKVMTSGDATLLEVAEANGIEIDYTCRMGSCGDCKISCKSGEVDMEEDEGLTGEEKEAGYVLSCVACPKSNVVLDV